MTAAPSIRHARPSDLDQLAAIEIAAGRLFPPERVPDPDTTIDPQTLQASLEQQALLVAEVDQHLVGFAVSVVADQLLHLEEISVHPDFGRRGIGRALMTAVIELAQQRQLEQVVLTTFSDIAWNAPFYETLGFEIFSTQELPPQLANILAQEKDHGLKNRVAMHLTPPILNCAKG